MVRGSALERPPQVGPGSHTFDYSDSYRCQDPSYYMLMVLVAATALPSSAMTDRWLVPWSSGTK